MNGLHQLTNEKLDQIFEFRTYRLKLNSPHEISLGSDFFDIYSIVIGDKYVNKITDLVVTYTIKDTDPYTHQIKIPFWLLLAVSERKRANDSKSVIIVPKAIFTHFDCGLPLCNDKVMIEITTGDKKISDDWIYLYPRACHVRSRSEQVWMSIKSYSEVKIRPESIFDNYHYLAQVKSHEQYQLFNGLFLRTQAPFNGKLMISNHGIHTISVTSEVEALFKMQLLHESTPTSAHFTALKETLTMFRIPTEVINLIWQALCRYPAEYVYWVPASAGINWDRQPSENPYDHAYDNHKFRETYLHLDIPADVCFSFSRRYTLRGSKLISDKDI